MKRGLLSILVLLFLLALFQTSYANDEAIYLTFDKGIHSFDFNPADGKVLQRLTFPACNPPICSSSSTNYSATLAGPLFQPRRWVVGNQQNVAPFKITFFEATDTGTTITYKTIPTLPAMHPASFPVFQLVQPSNDTLNDIRAIFAFMGVTSPTITIQSVTLNLNTFHFVGPVHNYMPYEPTEFLGGGVTRDGRLAFSVNFEPQSNQTVDNIFHYGNLSAGKIVGTPSQLLMFNATDTPTIFTIAGPVDVSSLISSAAPGLSPRSGMAVDHRLMVYRTKKVSGANITSQIFLQVLNVSGNTLTLAG